MNDKFEDYHEFLYNSLFCEYAYIINLDTRKLEFYTGSNRNPEANGRYADHYAYKDDHRYCGVVLVQSIPLSAIFAGRYRAANICFIKK